MYSLLEAVIIDYEKEDQKPIYDIKIAEAIAHIGTLYGLSNFTQAKKLLKLSKTAGYSDACLDLATLYLNKGRQEKDNTYYHRAIKEINEFKKKKNNADISFLAASELAEQINSELGITLHAAEFKNKKINTDISFLETLIYLGLGRMF